MANSALDWFNQFADSTPVGSFMDAVFGRDTTSSQSAEAALNGPANNDYHYHFGDFLSGTYNAARQQAAQNNADYAEWIRNEYSARQQRAFEEYMDSTKTQRAMADIKAAGLNPWLALQSAGFGGAIPAGASASSSAGQMSSASGNPGSSMASTALAFAALVKVIAAIAK